MNVRISLTLLIVVQLLLSSNISVLTYNIHALSPIIAGDDPESRIIKICFLIPLKEVVSGFQLVNTFVIF